MQGCRLRYLPPRLSKKGLCLNLPGPLGLWSLCRQIRAMDRNLMKQLDIRNPLGTLTGLFVLSRIFKWVYLISEKGKKVGMLGAYAWEPGSHAFITMVIWKPEDRSMGTGTKALGLITRELTTRNLCREFFVEVKKTNPRAISFWKKNGFKGAAKNDKTLIMRLSKTSGNAKDNHEPVD